mmetsp:Transcript_66550/g.188925  ORF Transcript_66550/g.188925 Transcript_66550/m.188925 type:complete len:568 (-) Transcript_66550:38-1741(-)
MLRRTPVCDSSLAVHRAAVMISVPLCGKSRMIGLAVDMPVRSASGLAHGGSLLAVVLNPHLAPRMLGRPSAHDNSRLSLHGLAAPLDGARVAPGAAVIPGRRSAAARRGRQARCGLEAGLPLVRGQRGRCRRRRIELLRQQRPVRAGKTRRRGEAGSSFRDPDAQRAVHQQQAGVVPPVKCAAPGISATCPCRTAAGLGGLPVAFVALLMVVAFGDACTCISCLRRLLQVQWRRRHSCSQGGLCVGRCSPCRCLSTCLLGCHKPHARRRRNLSRCIPRWRIPHTRRGRKLGAARGDSWWHCGCGRGRHPRIFRPSGLSSGRAVSRGSRRQRGFGTAQWLCGATRCGRVAASARNRASSAGYRGSYWCRGLRWPWGPRLGSQAWSGLGGAACAAGGRRHGCRGLSGPCGLGLGRSRGRADRCGRRGHLGRLCGRAAAALERSDCDCWGRRGLWHHRALGEHIQPATPPASGSRWWPWGRLKLQLVLGCPKCPEEHAEGGRQVPQGPAIRVSERRPLQPAPQEGDRHEERREQQNGVWQRRGNRRVFPELLASNVDNRYPFKRHPGLLN